MLLPIGFVVKTVLTSGVKRRHNLLWNRASNRCPKSLASGGDVTDRRATEDALQRSEQLFRTLVERSHDGIAMLDESGGLRYLSPSATRILGYTLAEAIRLQPQEWISNDDWNSLHTRVLHELALTGSSAHGSLRAPPLRWFLAAYRLCGHELS